MNAQDDKCLLNSVVATKAETNRKPPDTRPLTPRAKMTLVEDLLTPDSSWSGKVAGLLPGRLRQIFTSSASTSAGRIIAEQANGT